MKQERKAMEKDKMTSTDLKTMMEKIIMIAESSKDKEEIIEKLKGLSIVKDN